MASELASVFKYNQILKDWISDLDDLKEGEGRYREKMTKFCNDIFDMSVALGGSYHHEGFYDAGVQGMVGYTLAKYSGIPTGPGKLIFEHDLGAEKNNRPRISMYVEDDDLKVNVEDISLTGAAPRYLLIGLAKAMVNKVTPANV